MATLDQIEAHRAALVDLTTLANRDLVSVWRTLDLADAKAVAATLEAVLPDLTIGYGSAAATLAAQFYDDMRELAGVSGFFSADVADGPSAERAQVLARYGVQPLFSADPEPNSSLSLLAGGMQRLIANADRLTIASNAENDPADARWARHASANACAFCAMLATRGPVYRTASGAEGVVGRGAEKRHDGSRRDAQRKGIRARGTQGLGSKYHDSCHCTAVPVWGDDYQEAPYVTTWRDAYASTTSGDTKTVLAEMRSTLGTN